MAETTAISWADATFNPWIGCTKVSPECDNCYAERDNLRRGWTPGWGPGQPRTRTRPANWANPRKWDAKAKADGVRRRVFCASLADVFDTEIPDEWRDDLFALILETPHLDWMLLTKRSPVMRSYLTRLDGWPWPNVWVGVSAGTQETADARIPDLLATPAVVRWVSAEPLLGPVYFTMIAPLAPDRDHPYPRALDALYGGYWRGNEPVDIGHGRTVRSWTCYADGPGLDWVVTGGESGPGARPLHSDWVRTIRDGCTAAGVAFHFKQWGEWFPRDQWEGNPDLQLPDDFDAYRDGPLTHVFRSGGEELPVHRVGVRPAGRTLDGRTWDDVPTPDLSRCLSPAPPL